MNLITLKIERAGEEGRTTWFFEEGSLEANKVEHFVEDNAVLFSSKPQWGIDYVSDAGEFKRWAEGRL